jgi:hypothetical protein
VCVAHPHLLARHHLHQAAARHQVHQVVHHPAAQAQARRHRLARHHHQAHRHHQAAALEVARRLPHLPAAVHQVIW